MSLSEPQIHERQEAVLYVYTVESRDHAPPFVHARIGQKLIRGRSLHFRVTTITDHWMPRGRDLCTFSGCLVGKPRENDKIGIIMTQIAGLLAIATVFIGLWTLFTVRELMREGGWGRIHGILRYMHICMFVG